MSADTSLLPAAQSTVALFPPCLPEHYAFCDAVLLGFPLYVGYLKSPVASIQYVLMLNIFTEHLTSFVHQKKS